MNLPFVLPLVGLTTSLDIFVINSMFTLNGRFEFWCYPGRIRVVTFNPVQAEGGGGTLCPPTGFFPVVPKRFPVD